MIFMLMLAAWETTPASPDFIFLVNLGTAGIWLFMLLIGKMFTSTSVDRITAGLQGQIATVEKQNAWLIGELASRDQVIQAISTQLTKHTLPALEQTAQVFGSASELGVNQYGMLHKDIERLSEQLEQLTIEKGK